MANEALAKRYLELGALFVAVGVDTEKTCPVRPASIKLGPVSAALPGNRSTLQKFPSEEKMSDTSSALPESPRVCPFAQRAQHGVNKPS